MKWKSLSLQNRVRELFLHGLLSAALLTSGYTTPPQQQGPSSTLIIEAPAQVALGEEIAIDLILERAHDIGGYEAQLLFDTSAAHFSGMRQRDSDLKKFGRDVIPLEETELVDGIAMGLASCPFPDCVEMQGNPQAQGANGRVRLGSVMVGTDQEGLLELSFENLKFVDSQGNEVIVDVPQTRIVVQVGQENGASFPAPASSWQRSPSLGEAGRLDVTGEGRVGYADAIEGALEWKLGLEKGQPCGPANDLSRDVNGDGCIDVADIQLILANTGSAGPVAPSAEPAITSEPQVEALTALTLTVNSRGDSNDSNPGDGVCTSNSGCTLRAAITEANRHSGPDTILFNIPGGGAQTIQLNNTLPSLSDGSGGTTINGYSQPGALANTNSLVSNAQIMIQIRGNGPGAFDAFQVTSAGNRIQGLSIYNVHRPIWLYGSGARNNLVVGNFIGTNAAGTFGSTLHTLHASGVDLDGGANGNQIGGTSPAERNVISGNARHGINFNSESTDNNRVYNNLIGTNPSGTGRLQNIRHGIDMNSGPSYNIIGGTGAGQRNLMSGNGENQNEAFTAGIEISHSTLTSFNQVIGNCIGTDPTCNTAPSWAFNRHYGIRLEDGVNNNTIAYNIVGNSPQGGIRITGTGSNSNQVYGNRVGVSANNTAIPNRGFGIQIDRFTKFDKIGPNNIIANNPVGIEVLGDDTDNITITRNSIYNNNRLGIDLGGGGVSSNDSSDGDAGPNQVLNYPVLNIATTSQVTGTACAQSSVPKPCMIEIFIAERRTNDSGNGNYGQGRTFVGAGTTNTNGSFIVAISGVTAGQYLTATATDAAGNTSEFSRNIQASGSTNLQGVNITIGTQSIGSYTVLPIPSTFISQPGLVDGPVRVTSIGGERILTSERVISGNSFNEVMGYPGSQLTTDYWFPWYDNLDMDTWIMVGNPTGSTANVDIYIGGIKRDSYSIPPNGRITPRFNLQTGPVRVMSTNGVKIFTSERALFKGAFNEVMGYPGSQLTTDYWFPWYDNLDMDTWIMVGNPTGSTANVDIYIGGIKRDSYSIPPNGRITPRFNLQTGPVRVMSTNGVKIFTSERTLYSDSFNEVMGYPGTQLTTEYWFPWYDNSSMDTWILVGNPTGSTAAVDIYVGSTKNSYTIAAGRQINQRYNLNTGPARVVSTNGVKIFTSQRVLYRTSFNEVMGYPGNQLTTEYWFPWYDNDSMHTDIVVSMP